MNPFAIWPGVDMKTQSATNQATKTHPYHLPKGRNVMVVRKGETLVVTRQVPAAARRRAFEAILRHMDRQPARAGRGHTATQIVREMRDSGR